MTTLKQDKEIGKMKFEDALGKLLDGTALMFAGAGCSDGAINLRGRPFLKGSELAKHFAERAGVTGTIPSLDDAAEAFAERHGEDALIREIHNEFTAKSIADYHIQLAALPWKVIYTTNFDDVMEEAYKENSRVLVPVTTSDDPFSLPKGQTLCIHLNGFVRRLNLRTLGTELKLTESSYLSSQLADSPWATAFRYDINIARCILHRLFSIRLRYKAHTFRQSSSPREMLFRSRRVSRRLNRSPRETIWYSLPDVSRRILQPCPAETPHIHTSAKSRGDNFYKRAEACACPNENYRPGLHEFVDIRDAE